MKSKIALVTVTLVALIVAGASIVYAQSSSMSADRAPHTVTGSWIVDATPDSGAPPNVLPFVAYTAYEKDGVAISTTSGRTQLIGMWTRTDGTRFASTYQGFEPFGEDTLHIKVREAIELSRDGKTFTGSYVAEVFLLDGTQLATVTGTLLGSHMEVETLD